MQPVSYVSDTQHRKPAFDKDLIDESSVSLIKDLFDPNSDLTQLERSAIFVVMNVMDRRLKAAGIQ